ncbi:MAG: GNAT family N-acetyltransferase [Planctomycetaceae bacterium]
MNRSSPSDLAATYADASAFDGLRAEWHALWVASRSRTVFLTWEWLHSWWSQWGEGKVLRLILVRDAGGTLVGVAPFCIQRRGAPWNLRVLSLLGTEAVSSDYLDILAHDDHEEGVAAAVLALLLRDRGSWDLMELSDLLESSVVLSRFARCAEGAGLIARRKPDQVCPFLSLPEAVGQLVDVLGERTRRYLLKKRRRLLHKEIAIRLIDRPDQIDAALQRLFEIHEQRWSLKGLPGNFRQDRVRSFHASVAPLFLERGWLKLFEAVQNGVTVAVLYAFQDDRCFTYYQSGFSPEVAKLSPGGVLLGVGMEHAIENGRGLFDFLRGPEPYKWEWTSEHRHTHRLTLVRRRDLPTRFRHWLSLVGSKGKRLAKAILRRSSREKPVAERDAAEDAESRDKASAEAL